MDNKAYRTGEIEFNKKIAENVYLMKIKGNFTGKAGQFYMVRSWTDYPLLSRPLSICDIDEDGISFLYLVVGKGTEIFSNLIQGDKIKLLGPLGNGFKINEGKSAIIAGGIGLAPMKLLAKSLENKADLYVGYKDDSYFIDEMEDHVNSITISSDNGRCGVRGTVLDCFENKGYDNVYACGPNKMLEAVSKKVLVENIQLSMERNMACGIGACSGCTINTKNGYQRVCHEGPVFLAEEVIFDDEN